MARRRSPPVRTALSSFGETSPGGILADLLTFDRLMTGPVAHLIYWAGLGLIALGGFAVVGSAVGIALREDGWLAWALAAPTFVIGFLVLAVAALLWRSFCELYVAVFQIAADLKALRGWMEQGEAPPARPSPPERDPGDDDLLSRI